MWVNMIGGFLIAAALFVALVSWCKASERSLHDGVTCTEPRPERDSFYGGTVVTYEGLRSALSYLARKIERDEYVRHYSPVWIVNRRWFFRFKWARVAWYRFACWLWRKTGSKCKWPEGHPWHPLQTERIKAMGS